MPTPPCHSPRRRHLFRAAGLERNALCRPLDRARSRALVLAVLGVAVAALLGVATALGTLQAVRHQAATRAAHLHRLDAVVLTPARMTPGTGGTATLEAEAAWTYPAGQRHVGTVVVASRGGAGSTAALWVDDAGRPAAAPADPTDLAARAVCAGLLAAGGLGLLVALLRGLRLRTLDRRADRAWHRDWAVSEPVWSGRVHREPGGTDTPHGTC